MTDDLNSKSESTFQQSNDVGLCIILCTTPDNICASTIAQHLLESNLAACVTLLPGATSFYYWNGAIEQQTEVQLLIKSRITLQTAIFTYIKAHHPYQTPELLTLPITGSESDYLSWLNNSLL